MKDLYIIEWVERNILRFKIAEKEICHRYIDMIHLLSINNPDITIETYIPRRLYNE